MKVICNKCGKLVPEEEAIKMSVVDYKIWKSNADYVSFYDYEYSRYTQICEECYYMVEVE